MAWALFFSPCAQAFDGITLEFGEDAYGSRGLAADLYGFAARWDWDNRWFADGASYMSGQWELGIGYIQGDQQTTHNDHLAEAGANVIFRLYAYRPMILGMLPYAETGIGTHIVSHTRLSNRDISTMFHFCPSAGLGIAFGSRDQYEIGYRFWHMSNANIKTPNPGLDFHVLRLNYRFH